MKLNGLRRAIRAALTGEDSVQFRFKAADPSTPILEPVYGDRFRPMLDATDHAVLIDGDWMLTPAEATQQIKAMARLDMRRVRKGSVLMYWVGDDGVPGFETLHVEHPEDNDIPVIRLQELKRSGKEAVA